MAGKIPNLGSLGASPREVSQAVNWLIGRAVPDEDTGANISSKTSTINTLGKYAGKLVWDTTNNRLMRASGPAATDPWWVLDGSVSITPGVALDLNFATQSYASQGVSYALTSLPGYSYTRTGSVAYANGTVGTAMLDNFAADVVPVVSNGTGYEAYGAETNYAVASGDISSASWTVFGGAAKGAADSAVAPDGTATADAITLASGGTPTTASSQIYQNVSLAVSTTYTISAYVKSNTGANQKFRLKGNDNSIGDYLSPDLTATTQWQRFVFVFTTAPGATGFNVSYSNPGDGSATSLNVWGFQVLQGNFPDGGPVIATTTATASIGAPTFSMSCPNGSYTATYTFDDNSTQQISTTISSGVFTMPTLGTLNRAIVKEAKLV